MDTGYLEDEAIGTVINTISDLLIQIIKDKAFLREAQKHPLVVFLRQCLAELEKND